MALGSSIHAHHWRWVAVHFLLDGFVVWLAFLVGIWLRFEEVPDDRLQAYLPGIWLASLLLPGLLYVGGLYSGGGHRSPLHHARWLCMGFGLVLVSVLAIGSIDLPSRVGRGVMLNAFAILVPLVSARHLLLMRRRRKRWAKVACLAASEEDEAAAALLSQLPGSAARHLSLVLAGSYESRFDLPVLSRLEQGDVDAEAFDLLLVRDQHLVSPEIGPQLRRIRYQGVEVVSLADACEEAFHLVPLELVTESWLFRASHQTGVFYIKKVKRLFDILMSLIFLVLLAPFLLLGALWVKLASRGPLFYRQERAGRLGRSITVVKLRTMRPDAEADGAKWAQAHDSRLIPGGHWLRKFRIDEIPQLVNVLKGDMSFVGPRPERPEFIGELEQAIPCYRERLLVQPGLTGWAQVRYPYGASVDDAARKLEYDLYYMKHLSLFLDCFILLETVKIILLGGVRTKEAPDYVRFREQLAERPEPGTSAVSADVAFGAK